MAFLLVVIPGAIATAAGAIGGVFVKIRKDAKSWIKRMGLWSAKTRVLGVKELKPGDHICYPTAAVSFAYHHAIVRRVIDGETVELIHHSGPPGDNDGSFSSLTSSSSASSRSSSARKGANIAQIRKNEVNLSKFVQDGKIYRLDYENDDNCYPPDVVIERAESKIGEPGLQERGYGLLSNNCEHFATWCKTGVAFSMQSSIKHD